jgi:hypothetical protein
MNRLIVIIKNIFININMFKKPNPLILGRWNLDYCVKKVDRKVYLSNEDHCGVCLIHKDK